MLCHDRKLTIKLADCRINVWGIDLRGIDRWSVDLRRIQIGILDLINGHVGHLVFEVLVEFLRDLSRERLLQILHAAGWVDHDFRSSLGISCIAGFFLGVGRIGLDFL